MPHRKGPRQSIALVLVAIASASPIRAQTAACPDLDARAELASLGIDAPPDREGGPEYLAWGHGFERPALGVGYLEVETRDPMAASDWLPAIALPLYWRPADPEPGIWIHRGWWVPADDPAGGRLPLTYRGMVETGYEVPSFVVLEARADGWLALHVDIGPGSGRGVTSGVMWVPSCRLAGGPGADLRFIPWTDVFGPGGTASGITFRDGERHALRARPGTGAARIGWIEPRDEIEILELDGDWARVRTSRPGRHLTGCLGETWTGMEREGWVRWRDPASGPWIWYPTRGC